MNIISRVVASNLSHIILEAQREFAILVTTKIIIADIRRLIKNTIMVARVTSIIFSPPVFFFYIFLLLYIR